MKWLLPFALLAAGCSHEPSAEQARIAELEQTVKQQSQQLDTLARQLDKLDLKNTLPDGQYSIQNDKGIFVRFNKTTGESAILEHIEVNGTTNSVWGWMQLADFTNAVPLDVQPVYK